MPVPKKIYVARKYCGDDEILGFMVIADKPETKGFQNNKERADRWAAPKNLSPLEFDNTPSTGFSIVTNVSRYKTKNVIWRIHHPRGFEFEITSDNMADLLATNTLIDGVFQDEMFITENRQLVNHKTKLFKDQIATEEKKAELTEASKALNPGEGFRLDSPNNMKSNRYRYMGKFHSINIGRNSELHYAEKSTIFHVVHDLDADEYILKSKMDFSKFYKSKTEVVRLDYLDEEVNRPVTVKKINQYFHNRFDRTNITYNLMSEYRISICVSDKPFKLKDLKVVYRTVKTQDLDIADNKLYVHEVNGKPERVFGYQYTYNYKAHFAQKHTPKCTTLYTYKGEYDENNVLQTGVDLSKNFRMSGYYPQTIFSFDGYITHGKIPLSRPAIPDEIQEGYYTLNGE